MSKKVCILGEGAFGTAFATLLANNGIIVNLWCHEAEVTRTIQSNKINEKYFPNFVLSSNIRATADISEAVKDADFIFEAIPVKYLRSVIKLAKPFVKKEQIWITLSKGIEHDTLFFPTQIVDDVLEFTAKKAVISGPSFAKDLINQQLTVVNLATQDEQTFQSLSQVLQNNYFKTYFINDIIGIQVCGALKNVISLAIGMAEGAGYSDNTKGYLVTVGLNEMAQLTQFLGGKPETVYNFCGVGDLVISSFGNSGRNFLVGKAIGSGKKLQDILNETNLIPEGVNTAESVYQLIKQKNLDLPLCNGVYQVIFENKKFSEILL